MNPRGAGQLPRKPAAPQASCPASQLPRKRRRGTRDVFCQPLEVLYVLISRIRPECMAVTFEGLANWAAMLALPVKSSPSAVFIRGK